MTRSTRLAMSLLSSLVLAGCSVVGVRSGTEEPKYHVVETLGMVEIRQYAPRLAAETLVQGDEYTARGTGFRRLAGYIFGGNQSQRSIDMTAPVAQEAGQTIAMTAPVGQDPVGQDSAGAGGWRIRFFMPSQFTPETVPRPNDPAIHIVTLPAEMIGVYRYTGSIAPDAVKVAQSELLRLLQGSGWVAEGHPLSWFYDPPWTIPFLRRNETAVLVARPG